MKRFSVLASAVAVTLSLGAGAAQASTIDWATWTNVTTGATAGSASGSTASVTFTYNGELQAFVPGYPSYGPPGTFNGGTVGNAPPSANGIIQLFGGGTVTDTIVFATAVTNPVMAIWSLGQSGNTPSFNFNHAFNVESGGPSAEYGGGPITSLGNSVLGTEGNGTIQFIGTFTTLTWTNPQFENWYGFTIGTVSAVPEPATWGMMILGFLGLGFVGYRRKALALRVA